MSCNVAFIGLGVMGYPMAGYISKGGHNVTVFNRTKTKAEKWVYPFLCFGFCPIKNSYIMTTF